MPNTNAFYEVKMNGRYRGQDIVNIFYYRLGFDLIPGDFNLAGADTLATVLKDTVWDSALVDQMLVEYLLDTIVVTPRDSDFNPIYQLPYTLQVGEYGVGVGTSNGAAPCLIANFNLTPTTLLQGFTPPKRGYVALGPLADGIIDSDGNLEGNNYDAWQNACESLALTLTSIVPPATFHPIRLKTTRILGGLITLNGWADIHSVNVRHKTSFRRSRVGEA